MTSTSTATDTSVVFSLSELANIEEERVREEAAQRAALERDVARARHAAIAADRAAEESRLAADAERRQRLEREAAEQNARDLARERAAVEVARIEANAKSQLAADNAARAHDLRVLQMKADSGRSRLRYALGAVIGLVVLGGAATAWGVGNHVTELERQSQQVRDDRFALNNTHEAALASQLTTLDARQRVLHERATSKLVEASRLRSEAARGAIEAGGVDAPKLRAFSDALDLLAADVHRSERVSGLDRRFSDLRAWAGAKTATELVAAASATAAKAHDATADDATVTRYADAVDALASALANGKDVPRIPGVGPKKDPTTKTAATWTPCEPTDPFCGLDGKPLDTN